MKTHKQTQIGLLSCLISGTALAQNSFNDYSGWVAGQTTGTTSWAGFGDVTSTVTFFGDADGIAPSGGVFPNSGSGQGNLAQYGSELTAATALTFLAGGTTAGGAFTELNLTFSDGAAGVAFPTESVIYLTDNDVEAVIIEAFIGGVSVDVSNWFVGNVQTSSSAALGEGSGWDPATATTVPFGANAEFFVQEFRPDTAFDQLVITNTNAAGGRIGFNIGNVSLAVPVPEPSSTLLVALGGLGLLARRKR